MKEPLRTLLLMGVKQAGSYNPEDALLSVEESMTVADSQTAWKFLGWCHENGRKFGHGTIDKVFADWKAA